jgi:general secretion pathway protein K
VKGRSEEGIALIAVLWVLTLLSIVAAALSSETRSSARIARNMADNAAARTAADAGIQRAILDLITIPDRKKFRTDGTVYSWRFANSTVRVSIHDEVSKIDLNQAPEPVLVALFVSDGVDPGTAQSLAAAIADFRDPDNFSRLRGAEEADYQAAGLAWGPKNMPFQALEELQEVFGMTTDTYERVVPDLTIYSVYRNGTPVGSTSAGGRASEIAHQAGFSYTPSQGLTFSIRSEAESPNGAAFIRDAIVQLISPASAHFLAWRRSLRSSYHRPHFAKIAPDNNN